MEGRKYKSSDSSYPFRDLESRNATPFRLSGFLVYKGDKSKHKNFKNKKSGVLKGEESRLAPLVQRWINEGRFGFELESDEEDFCRLVKHLHSSGFDKDGE